MKHIRLSLALISFLSLSCVGHAMPTYGHFVGEEGPILISGEAEYVADHDLSNGVELESFWYGLQMGRRIKENTTIFGYIGTAYFENIDTIQVQENETSTIAFDSDFGLAYGAGIQQEFYKMALLSNEKEAIFFANGNGRYIKVDTDGASHIDSGSTLSSNNADITYMEWQVALGVSQELTIYGHNIPLFAGVTYNDVFVDLGGNAIFNVPNSTNDGETHPESVRLFDENASDNFGVFVGIKIPFDENRSFSIEGRLLTETAVSAEGTIRF